MDNMDLQTMRVIKKKKQWDLAIATGIPQSKISLMENGYVIPNEGERAAIAEALGVATGEIGWPGEILNQCEEASR